jgi:hypothetical protein
MASAGIQDDYLLNYHETNFLDLDAALEVLEHELLVFSALATENQINDLLYVELRPSLMDLELENRERG